MGKSVINDVVGAVRNNKAAQPKPPKVKQKLVVNRVAFVIDDSGSMGSVRKKVAQSFNKILAELVSKSNQANQLTYVSLFVFGDVVREIYSNLLNGREISINEYSDSGGTALFDAVGKVTESLSKVYNNPDADVSYLVVTLTDGDENQSHNYNMSTIQNLLEKKNVEGNWTYAFQCANEYQKNRIIRQFGSVASDNVGLWEVTNEGVERATGQTMSAVETYTQSRSLGFKSVDNFYVITDLSKVDPKKLKSELDDVSDKYKVLTVPNEISIKEFIEIKTKKPYKIGSSFYQITKTETVQPSKNLLVMEKGKKAIWSGPTARQLAQIPENTTCKVTPGNMANLELFVESRSTNRKLVRGTKVLFDPTVGANKQPTWEDPNLL